MNKIFFILAIFLTSCQDVNITPKSDQIVVTKDNNYVEKNKLFSNPTVFMGSDFGNFFNTLYKQGKFKEMISFTSSQSIKRFGEDKIIEFYKNELRFGYEIGRPHSQTIEGDTITLNYSANIIATKRVIRISVVVENDSCKILLPDNLKNFPS